MKVLQVNTVYGEGSTGKIVMDIQGLCKENGIHCVAACRYITNGKKPADTIEISSRLDAKLHGALARFTMLKGCFSYFKTRSFVRKIKKYSPDIVHLHNLHGSYVNVALLAKLIKREGISVVFTLHDCWAFTAICPHFSVCGCDKWKQGCASCPQRKKYSSSLVDLSRFIWQFKKKHLTGFDNAIVVTPSRWLAGLVKQSFLNVYPVKVINNGIDLDVFKPTESDFRKKHSLENKRVVLAVAFGWSYSKGLDVVKVLAYRFSDDYRLVIVGTDDKVNKALPSNVLCIHRTNNRQELAEIYSAADVLVNPTREEVLGLVNVEALACGTPVVTFNAGGSPECIDETCGAVVETDDIEGMYKEVVRICTDHPYTKENCVKRAKLFDKNQRLNEYIQLYKSMEKKAEK